MTPPTPVTEDELQAYVDGVLDGDTRARVAVWLADNPEDAVRIAAYGAQIAALRDAYDLILDEPVPPALRDALRAAPQPGAVAPDRRQHRPAADRRRRRLVAERVLAGRSRCHGSGD